MPDSPDQNPATAPNGPDDHSGPDTPVSRAPGNRTDPRAAPGNGDSGQLHGLAWFALGSAPSWGSLLIVLLGSGLGDGVFTWLFAMPLATIAWLGLLCAPVRTFVTTGGKRIRRATFFFGFLAFNLLPWLAVVAIAVSFVFGIEGSFN